jgi:GR25 family glycosyltransferase involved in LPS biosynthesis
MRNTSKKIIKILYQMLYDADRLLTFHDIPYWLTRGSFLGAIRHGGIIPWDDDVDISIFSKDARKLLALRNLFGKCGYVISRGSHGYYIHRKRNEYPHIDVYTIKKSGDEYVPSRKRVRDEKPDDFFKKDELFPLKRIAFGGFLAFVPKEYSEYFRTNYGRAWKTKDWDGRRLRSKQPAKPFKVTQKKCLPPLRPELKGSSPLNKFCSRVFVINLHDYRDRLKGIARRMKRKGIGYTLFDAIDGRCKTDEECYRKRKALESEFHVKITTHEKLPPLSLTLGTWYLLKQQVKNRWKAIAIFEDDATFVNNFNSRFSQGVKELKSAAPDWDLLYLGCTQFCGVRGISKNKTSRNKHLSSIYKFNKKANFYVRHRDDIRLPCARDECEILSKNLAIAAEAAGGFGYCISLKGARKILRIMKSKIEDHMDGLLPEAVVDGKLFAVAFDPPIVNHFGGADRPDTALEWDWEI